MFLKKIWSFRPQRNTNVLGILIISSTSKSSSKFNSLRTLIKIGILKIKGQEPLRTFVLLNNKYS